MDLPITPAPEAGRPIKPIPWFRTGPFVLISSATITVYALLGNFSPYYRAVVDVFISPIIDSLGWAFLNIRTSPMSGELDPIYYRNLMGLCVLFSALYNIASALYMVKVKKIAAASCEDAHKNIMIMQGVGVKKGWVLLHLGVYFIVGGIAAFTTFIFLNCMFGWFEFLPSRYDMLFTLIVCLALILPSSFCVAMWSIVGQLVFFDFRKIFEFIVKK
ncbi:MULTISPECIES: hypothetical protein [Pseudomonas]|uniref:Transmembrane protein n=1 Tax=Pseudomonas gingeri TaxID=117681 RepID=A0A7Y8BSK3_9PSED|nr:MULTISPECIES: hypothetical protein [Pseudomonas]MPQ70470.1 hypothetical protein [Pseudomonas sp. MWU12-2323]NWB86895.1 hypothetical protein [Pseudomonas gingeri]